MFTYLQLFKLTPIAREHLEKTPEYFDKIHNIVEAEGGTVERFLAVMGPWSTSPSSSIPISRPRSASSARSRSSRCSKPRPSPRRTSRCSRRRSSSTGPTARSRNDGGRPRGGLRLQAPASIRRTSRSALPRGGGGGLPRDPGVGSERRSSPSRLSWSVTGTSRVAAGKGRYRRRHSTAWRLPSTAVLEPTTSPFGSTSTATL